MSHEHAAGSARCREIFAMLSGYLDGELDAASRAQLERHLTDCTPCVGFLDSLQRTVGLLRTLPAHELPEDVRRELLETHRKLRESSED